MRLLVLGGTKFLSEAVAAEAVRRGHDVTCACRGSSGSVPEGARLVHWDRADGEGEVPDLGRPDAVVDVARHPSWVRTAVEALPDAHWVFVSTVNVYADTATPGGTPATLPLVDAVLADVDLAVDPDAYGPMKAGCEQLVREGAASCTIIRPGLIVGPGDPSGRFTYWPERLADGGETLAGGDPTDLVQVVDVRDLAAWIVTAAEQRTTGAYDGVGPAMAVGDLLAQVAQGVGSGPTGTTGLTWVADDVLAAHDVQPWAGDDALPLWLPRPAYDGMLSHDVAPSYAAGLTTRPIAETARDTLAWARAHPDAARTGLSREREAEVLAALRD
jgi:nucleoside-diphosphate-sugar epimerase